MISYFQNREDRRRGYIGRDYGEDDDEIDYSKSYGLDEDVNLFERRPKGNTMYRTIGESIILGAAAAATTADRNRPQLVKHPSQHTVIGNFYMVNVVFE